MSNTYFADGNDHPYDNIHFASQEEEDEYAEEVRQREREDAPMCDGFGCELSPHPESTVHRCCAACTLESYICDLSDHAIDKPNPVTQEWFTQGAEIEKQIMLWKIRAAQ